MAYLYSGQMNRDLLKKHDPNKDYNVFWELLLSSLTPSFQGFHDGRYQTEKESIYLETVDITPNLANMILIQRESGKSSGEF